MPKSYTRNLAPVIAIQIDKKNLYKATDFLAENKVSYQAMGSYINIFTDRDTRKAIHGDFIVKDFADGRIYPVACDVFKAIFQEVNQNETNKTPN